MRVALVGPYPEPGQPITGGVERVIDTLLPELRKHVEVTLVVPGAKHDHESENHGSRTIYLRRGRGPGVLRYWNVDAARLHRVVSAIGADLVHLHGLAGLGWRISTPRILTVHGIAERDLVASGYGKPWSAMTRRALATLMRRVEVSSRGHIGNVIVISPYVNEVLPDITALNQFSVPNPIDPAFCLPTLPSPVARSRRILSVGRISRRKNTLGILQFIAGVMSDDPSVTISFCGEPIDRDYFNTCQEFVEANGLAGRVEFVGTLSTPDLIPLLDTSALLIQDSLQETAPVAVAEAQARGVPVLAPNTFGLKYMIEPGLDGFFLPGGRDDNVGVVHRALAHEWDRQKIAAIARRRYGVGNIAERTVDIYREVVAASTAGANARAPRESAGGGRSQ
ncbi:glycosyltransferase family 4 protein [Devosia sp.]|uniref:glycosyltransferase family 4 protein n=1 Tax=Devosia sp. TaxID=1871048 RepID=UPI003F703300